MTGSQPRLIIVQIIGLLILSVTIITQIFLAIFVDVTHLLNFQYFY